MSQYPGFNGSSPFVSNSNQLPFNLNQNINIPSHVSQFQQNPNMSFLSFPPPSLTGSHHVFQNGPRFPGAINTMQPAGFATNIPNGNIISPLPFTLNSPGMTSVPPPQGSPMWIPTPYDQTQPPNHLNGGSNYESTRNVHGNFQQTPQKLNAQSMNPWSPTSSNNFQNSTSDAVNQWVMDTPKAKSHFDTFETGRHNSNATSQNYVGRWASDTSSSNFPHNFQGTPMQNKQSPSKFRQSKSPASDINPWAQPPTVSTGSTIDNYRSPNERDRHYQHNKFNQRNFNNRRGNSRFFSNNNQNKRQNRNFKGERDVKREINESKPYSCDTCDRGFASEVEFQGHMAEHIKCNFRNCRFEAHPKIVTLHKRMQHDTGYADAINKLKNADDIEKWRAERRRRFPTAANILKRKAEQVEKEDRGEVIENKDFGKFKRQNTGQREEKYSRPANRKRGRSNNKNNKLQRERMHALSVRVNVSDSGSDSDDDSHIKLRKFSGVLAVTDAFNPVAEECISIHDSPKKSGGPIKNATSEGSKIKSLDSFVQKECEENKSTPNSEKIEPIGKSINGSSSSYPIDVESDDDAPIECTIVKTQSNQNYNNDDSPIEIPVSKVPLNEVSKSINVDAKNLSSIVAKESDAESDDSPVEIPVSKVPLNEISNSASIVAETKPLIDSKRGHATNTGRNYSKEEPHRRNTNKKYEQNSPAGVRKSSLLEKLLADDIRHERNVIMQCIRHIVKKKFFGIGSDA